LRGHTGQGGGISAIDSCRHIFLKTPMNTKFQHVVLASIDMIHSPEVVGA